MVGLALELGASFIARSFSGDKEQLIPLIKAAMSHPGFALIDVVSPCVTFNNNPGSTKSYDYTREHMEATAAVDFVPLMSKK
jgi:2-oxoglutarate ferredoxin oxidoreductase subunit beta